MPFTLNCATFAPTLTSTSKENSLINKKKKKKKKNSKVVHVFCNAISIWDNKSKD